MKIGYFDCIGGASGDMILGALIDSGLSLDSLCVKFRKLHIQGWEIQVKKVLKQRTSGKIIQHYGLWLRLNIDLST